MENSNITDLLKMEKLSKHSILRVQPKIELDRILEQQGIEIKKIKEILTQFTYEKLENEFIIDRVRKIEVP